MEVDPAAVSGSNQGHSHYDTETLCDPETPSSEKDPALPSSHSPLPSCRKGGHAPGLYPFSAVLLVIWFAYIACTLWLCEKSVALSQQLVEKPWAYDVLPGVLLTIFAQAHSAVTGVYLSRLAVSALQRRGATPLSWAELFWLADGKWKEPIGIGLTVKDARRLGTRLSKTFILFSVISLVTMVTPVSISRAYPTGPVSVPVSSPCAPNIFTPSILDYVDAETVMAVGQGSWMTGQTVQSLYNSSVYVPTEVDKDTNGLSGNAFFFSGDLLDYSATVPGLLLDGNCTTVGSASDLSVEDHYVSWAQYCTKTLGVDLTVNNVSYWTTVEWMSRSLEMVYCSEMSSSTPFSFENSTGTNLTTHFSAYALVNASTSFETTKAMFTAEIFYCTSSISIGTAEVSGTNRTYTSFVPQPLYQTKLQYPSNPIYHPLAAFLYGALAGSEESQRWATIAPGIQNAMGLYPLASTEEFNLPSPNDMAQRLWQGAAHMTSAMGFIARSAATTYDCTKHVQTVGRHRIGTFVVVTYVLLGTWFLALAYLTAKAGGRSFGSSLDSYISARLLASKKELIEGRFCGDAAVSSSTTILE
jgi:hypothetical protein